MEWCLREDSFPLGELPPSSLDPSFKSPYLPRVLDLERLLIDDGGGGLDELESRRSRFIL